MYCNGYILAISLTNVLDKWKNEFCSLCNKSVNEHNANTEFYRTILHMNDPTYIEKPERNGPLLYDEVEMIVSKLKLNKVSGINQTANEFVKHYNVMLMLYLWFTKCFDSGLVPSILFMAIITPIPKCSSKDPYVPLNYRGILNSLSCVSKAFQE